MRGQANRKTDAEYSAWLFIFSTHFTDPIFPEIIPKPDRVRIACKSTGKSTGAALLSTAFLP